MDVSGQLDTPATLTQEDSPSIPIVREAGWAPASVWTSLRRENRFPLPGIEPRLIGHPFCSLVTILTELQILIK